jgi:hypothetical protein
MVLFLIVVYVAARYLIGPEVVNRLKYNKMYFYNVHWPLPFLYVQISVDILMIKMFFSFVQCLAGSKIATIHYTKFDENANQQTQ